MIYLCFLLLHSSDIITWASIGFVLHVRQAHHFCAYAACMGERKIMTTDSNSAGPPARTHEDYYTALYQAALTISSSLELEEVLQSVVRSITQAMQVKGCVLRLLDTRTDRLQLSAVYG